jgi:hypothetical protein
MDTVSPGDRVVVGFGIWDQPNLDVCADGGFHVGPLILD